MSSSFNETRVGNFDPVAWGTVYPSGPGLRGLGLIDAHALIAEAGSAVQQAKDLWAELEAALGIGAGRREADVIVPFQNRITSNILVPVVDMGSHPTQHTCNELSQMLGALNNAASQFRSFLLDTDWIDGRAADQALFWLEGPLPATVENPSWFHQVQTDFSGDVAEKCGTGGGIPIPGTGVSLSLSTVLLIAAGLLLARPAPRSRGNR
jgi:hypothetical protein